ncbi:GNAT family N-acetyltransferase [Cytobacillus sp. FSL W7-1323]|uniref:GNAT family N-acetyltransferase n=1 Tax=Cytobacillus kochii TaxID=859143 RepID=A0A248TI02_9BACI|nr:MULTISPECIES: GNAT family N-acetyltransferase [Cytobacillus]ASV67844.1 GNAT family N-acetyltransferase [Cytobacillus kochii]MEA1853902.1 GNAT family N-acetyltransferase [Cytobacillus sp. OWB-43]
MEIKKASNRHYGIDDSGKEQGEVTFSERNDHTIVIDHTYVEEEARGTGLAEQLVDSVVQEVKSQNKKIVPACPFVAALFKKKAEYREVQA